LKHDEVQAAWSEKAEKAKAMFEGLDLSKAKGLKLDKASTLNDPQKAVQRALNALESTLNPGYKQSQLNKLRAIYKACQ
jgi:hypothetical protein